MEKMSERTRCEEEDRKEAIHTGACSSCATMTPAAGPLFPVYLAAVSENW